MQCCTTNRPLAVFPAAGEELPARLLAAEGQTARRRGRIVRGANLRSAWAFTLWGDPTLTLPRPPRPPQQLPPIRHRILGNTLLVSLPTTTHDKVQVGRYESQMLPNARLAGLLTVSPRDEDVRRVLPLIFTEIHLPEAPPMQTPKLSSGIPEKNWVFCWDSHRRTGYLLVKPRGKDKTELSFRIRWESNRN